jgi:voltage-gated potassium channel
MLFRILFQFFSTIFQRRRGSSIRAVIILFVVLLYGAVGFCYFERGPDGPTLSDGLWYSLVTMTTVGYGDFFPKTTLGRFAVGMPLMFVGIGILGYLLSAMASALVFHQNQKQKGMGVMKLENHLIIINVPSVAKVEQVIRELRGDPTIGGDREVVIVSEDLEELPQVFHGHEVYFIKGNPTRDDTLTRAGLDQAAYAVILCRDPKDAGSDNLNLAIALAIETRSAKVVSAVECIDPGMMELFRRAKCDRIVCLSKFESRFISHELLNPGSQDLLEELLCSARGQQLYLTEIPIAQTLDSYAELRDLCHRQRHVLVGLRRGEAQLFNPSDEIPLASGDEAITIGEKRLIFSS